MLQKFDGLSRRYQRKFEGSSSIFAEQKSKGVVPLRHANSMTYWKFDAASNLKEKWDTPLNKDTGKPMESSDIQNVFKYNYSASNKETWQYRNIEIRQQNNLTTNTLYSTYGGQQGIYLAASINTTVTSYNDRDQITVSTSTDRTPTLSATNPARQDQIASTGVIRRQSYVYYLDGRLKRGTVSDGSTDQGYKEIQAYDLRGRETLIYDSNGSSNRSGEARADGRIDFATSNSSPGTISISYYGKTVTQTITQGKEQRTLIETKTVGGLTASTERRYDSAVGVSTGYREYTVSKTQNKYGYNGWQSAPASTISDNSLEERNINPDCVGTTTGCNKLITSIQTNHSTSDSEYDFEGKIVKTTHNSSNDTGPVSVMENQYEYAIPQFYMTKITLRNGAGSVVQETYYGNDSKGNRTSAQIAGISYVKRYNPDHLVDSYNTAASNSVSSSFCSDHCYGIGVRYNDFRYDPFGQQVLSSTAQIEEQNSPEWLQEHGVWRDWTSTHIANGEVQDTLRRAGNYVWKCKVGGSCTSYDRDTYRTLGYQYRDASYSLIDGAVDSIAWNGTRPFAVSGRVQSLDAPVKSLSSILKINPLEVVTQGLPRLPDPGQITGPGVEAKDVPLPVTTGANQDQKQAVTSVTVGPALPPASTLTSAAPAGQTLSLEVAPGFDDGEGFAQPIYAVQPQDQLSNDLIKQYGFWGALWRYNAARIESEANAVGKSVDLYLADQSEKILKDRMDNARIPAPDKGEKARKDLNYVLNYSHKMSPTRRLAFQEGINALLDTNRVSPIPGVEIFSPRDEAIKVISELARTIERLGDIKPDKVQDSMLAVAGAAYAQRELQDAEMDIISFLGLGGPEGELVNFGLRSLGSAVSTLMAKVAPRALEKGISLTRATKARGSELIQNLLKKGCLNSFAPSTSVRTLSGLVAISALSLGTPVLAFNEQTGENGYYPITAVHRNIDPDITYLTIQDPEQGNKSEFIETTPEHPFYLATNVDTLPRPQPEGHADLSAKWVGAGHLKIGDQIKQADGTVGVITNVVTVQQTQQMFNLTVDEAHTFYVGQDGWLVHNQTRTPDGRFTAPTLPPGTIVSQGEVKIQHFYKGTDHGPAHLHVVGGGRTTRIGSNGKPLAGDPPLTSAQQRVVDEHLKEIRKAGQKIGKYMEFLEVMEKGCPT